MFPEDALLPISALQHLSFCSRRCALVLLEGIWEENVFTAEGTNLHERVHQADNESRGDMRIVRGLRLRSLRLGLSGVADVVEFHRIEGSERKGIVTAQTAGLAMTPESQIAAGDAPTMTPMSLRAQRGSLPPTPTPGLKIAMPAAGQPPRNDSSNQAGVRLDGVNGYWQPFPVEYKRSTLKHEPGYEVQLCAQALCLEEMLGARVECGAIFYGKSCRRQEVDFTDDLRASTEAAALQLHDLFEAGRTPKAEYGKKCKSCSLYEICMPKVTGIQKDVAGYLKNAGEL